jgi:hypothetical protein
MPRRMIGAFQATRTRAVQADRFCCPMTGSCTGAKVLTKRRRINGRGKEARSCVTPYAPAVLTLRAPSTAIPLSCSASSRENTAYAGVAIADSLLCDLAECNF